MSAAGPVLASIGLYPVKALRGVCPAEARATVPGLEGDRRWTVVDADNRFLTQREHPRMALIAAEPAPAGIRLRAPGCAPIEVSEPRGGERIAVLVWRDRVAARLASARAASWLSAALGTECRLAWMDDVAARPCDPAYALPDGTVSFADGFPILLATTASLADLNARLPAPVGMDRFRPNLVVDGASPWEEDRWVRLRIGGAVLRVAKPCARCVVTTIDPATGGRPDPDEPIRTLRRFRRDRTGGLMFGQNLVVESEGRIALGDRVEALERGPPNVVPPSRD